MGLGDRGLHQVVAEPHQACLGALDVDPGSALGQVGGPFAVLHAGEGGGPGSDP